MRLGNGGGRGAGNCAQRSSRVEADGASADDAGRDTGGRTDTDKYGGAPYMQLGGARPSANAVCSIVCCVTGSRTDSDDEAPAANTSPSTLDGGPRTGEGNSPHTRNQTARLSGTAAAQLA